MMADRPNLKQLAAGSILLVLAAWGTNQYYQYTAREDEARRCLVDLQELTRQLSWYAKSNQGRLPASTSSLPGMGPDSFLANGYELMTPSAKLTLLPQETVILRRALVKHPGNEIVMKANGDGSVRPLQPRK